MKKTALIVILILVFKNTFSQLYPIPFAEKINSSSLVVEGEVIKQHCFWNESHSNIFTSNTLKVYKLFKGKIVTKEIEIITQGGTIGNYCVVVTELLQLHLGEKGIFTLEVNRANIKSPFTKTILLNAYSSSQGFFKYDLETKEAWCPFVHYNIFKLYELIETETHQNFQVVDPSFSIENFLHHSQSALRTLAVINSFSPNTLNGGTLNDPANNTLTINGSGFGSTPSGKCGVEFKSGNNDNPNPDGGSKVKYNSTYIKNWSDNQIVVSVPDFAATGLIAVVLADGTEIKSSAKLTVFYSVLNAGFFIQGDDIRKEPRLMNTNNSGGYTFLYSTNTAGSGIDLSTDPAKETIRRAVATWKEIAGANLKEGGNTSVQKIDPFDVDNILVYDNQNTGNPPLDAGVLESTSSGFSMCTNKTFEAQKTGFDILIRNPGFSVGNILVNDGPCFPTVGEYDLELILLHEFGHALNLAHINDDYEISNSNSGTINPAKVMHYSVLDFTNRRSPDASALQGVLYTINPQNKVYGSCGLYSAEMLPLSIIPFEYDNCPGSFPSTALEDGTQLIIDLVHSSSNKFIDPSFEQVNCQDLGTFVTNNAFYAFKTNDSATQSLQISISGYNTVPADLNTCSGQGVRLALYDVTSCPQGQNFPMPIVCKTFSGDGNITPITGLQSNHNYLLYFDGLRNTKAIFNASLNRTDVTVPNNSISVFPNPVQGDVNIKFFNTVNSKYQYVIYDITGKLIVTETLGVSPTSFLFKINMMSLASGTYYLRIIDAKGEVALKQKILKISN